jgi:hypothetical protein
MAYTEALLTNDLLNWYIFDHITIDRAMTVYMNVWQLLSTSSRHCVIL